MIARLYILDLKSGAAGTLLGNSWAFAFPFIYFLSYILLFAFVFDPKFAGLTTLEYIGLILVGLAPALSFSQGIAGGVGSIVGNAGLLKGTLVDIEAIPVRHILSVQPTLITGLVLALFYYILIGRVSWTTPLVLVIWALQTMLSIGILWILAPLNVYIRDVGQVVPALITPLMMVSPIAYPVADAPAILKVFLWFNPFFYFIACYQDVIVFKELPDPLIFGILVILSVGLFVGGFRVVSRAKAALIDSM